uniref:Aminopeptidase n=1 Tax=Scleropages formosus TaxID=113540 RepID=A0A8C9WG68_SCLFO
MSRGARRVSKTAARAAVTAAVLALLLAAIAVIAVHQGKWKRDPPEGRPVVVTAVLSEAPPNMRLPKSLIPDRYRVYLQVHLDSKASNVTRETFTFSGNSTVKFKCTEATAWIYIHCKDLNVTFLRAMDEKQSTVEVKNVTVKKDESNFLEIELRDTLRANETYYLITAFSGPLVHDSAGLYIIEYRENEGSQRYLATSHMQPTDARKVFPCFDEPHMKAVFEVTIIHRKDTIALTNAAQKAEINIEDEAWLITEFFPTQHMSTYLLAFTVFNYEAKMTDYGRYTWGPPEAIVAGHADYAHRISGQILKFFEDHYDMKYPLPKLDQVAVAKLAGNAMENWGLVMYNKKAILYEEGVSTTTEKENIAAVIAHELAHQWFGNLVTMKWWNDLWLNEAFATYYSYLGVDGVEPAWNFKDLIISNEVQYMLQFESLDSSRPIIKEEDEVQSPEDIAEQFDIITYKKATNDSNKNIQVAEMMESWTKQEGYPVITINTSSGEVSQRHFLLNQSAEQNLTWHVPIKVMKSGLREVNMQYSPLTVSKPTYKSREEEWILANVNSTGYYRVNYDLENWRRLVMQLETQHQEIPVISRGQLIDDAFNLAVARQINFTLALDTTKFLRKETEFIPWNSAIKSFQYLKHLLDFTEVSSPMKAYIRKLVAPLYDHFEACTVNSTVPDSLTAQYNQINAVTLACSNDVTKCHKMATDAFNKLEKNPDSEWIHPNLKRRIYCTAIAAGGEKEWDFAWEMFQNTKSMTEKKDLLSALACTKQTSLLKRYLEYSLDPDKIKKSDFFSIIQFIATNADGQQLAWDFIQSKWEYIIQTYEEEEVPVIDLIHGVTQRFSSEAKLEELRQFLKNQGEEAIPSVVWALESAIESTQFNIQWVQENKQNFLDWFHRESVAH